MKPARREPIVVVLPVKDTNKETAAKAARRARQILSGTEAFHRYIRRMEAAGWK